MTDCCVRTIWESGRTDMAFNRENTKQPPCMGCSERHEGCHGKCGRYKAWREMLDSIRQARQDANIDIMSEAKKKKIWRNNRYSRKKM